MIKGICPLTVLNPDNRNHVGILLTPYFSANLSVDLISILLWS